MEKKKRYKNKILYGKERSQNNNSHIYKNYKFISQNPVSYVNENLNIEKKNLNNISTEKIKFNKEDFEKDRNLILSDSLFNERNSEKNLIQKKINSNETSKYDPEKIKNNQIEEEYIERNKDNDIELIFSPNICINQKNFLEKNLNFLENPINSKLLNLEKNKNITLNIKNSFKNFELNSKTLNNEKISKCNLYENKNISYNNNNNLNTTHNCIKSKNICNDLYETNTYTNNDPKEKPDEEISDYLLPVKKNISLITENSSDINNRNNNNITIIENNNYYLNDNKIDLVRKSENLNSSLYINNNNLFNSKYNTPIKTKNNFDHNTNNSTITNFSYKRNLTEKKLKIKSEMEVKDINKKFDEKDKQLEDKLPWKFSEFIYENKDDLSKFNEKNKENKEGCGNCGVDNNSCLIF